VITCISKNSFYFCGPLKGIRLPPIPLLKPTRRQGIVLILKRHEKDIHPEYKEVVFHDLSADYKFLTRSCAPTTETTEFEGNTYPVFKLEVSSQSHPFYTGKNMLVDTAGRIDKFKKRYEKKK